MDDLILVSASVDPAPEYGSSTPHIAGASVRVAFVIGFVATVLALPGSASAYDNAGPVTQWFAGGVCRSAEKLTHSDKWDGIGIYGVRDATIEFAQRLLDEAPREIPEPHLSSSDDGEIGLSWTLGRDRFEAVVDAEDRLVWVSKVGGKYGEGGDVSVCSDLDKDLFYSALKEFYGRT